MAEPKPNLSARSLTSKFSGSLTRITHVALRYRLDDIVLDEELEPSADTPLIRWLWHYFPTRLLPQPKHSRAKRLRLALEHLGPVFIKFGQILSTRRDLLPPEYADELALLQDRVPPFDGAQALNLVAAALGEPLTQFFKRIDEQPLASASVAQVHAAELLDGTEVVVKVIRPDIEPMIRQDVQLLRRVAELLERLSTDARRLHLIAVVDDFDATILGELDLLQEARNTVQLRHNFAESESLYVPRVYRDLCRTNVLVLERVYGVPVANVDQLLAAGTNMRVLAERGVQTFFTQVFVDNFFHADMHPGNIFVDVSDPESPRYIAIDCAIIGQLTAEDQDYLARNLVAFFNRDYAMVATLHLESGWIPEDTSMADFERVIRDVCDPIFDKPLAEISFGHFLITLFQTARSFNMEVQPQLVLLQKTLLNIEGLGRQLYPELDLWSTAKPFMEQWMVERTGPAAALRDFNEHAPALAQALPNLTGVLANAGTRLKRLDRQLGQHRSRLKDVETQLAAEKRRRWFSRAAAVGLLLLAGSLVWSDNGLSSDTVAVAVATIAAVLLFAS